MKEIDARGLNCPQPVILTKKALEEIEEGEILTIVDNITAKENISRLAENLSHQWEVTDKDGCYHIKIKKLGTAVNAQKYEDIVVVITTDKLGKGDDALGAALMKAYTYTLAEAAPIPKTVIFINSGVKLVCDQSEVLANLEKLDSLGVEIISCGTCLDFYNIKDKIKIGIIGNMYLIVEKMNNAVKVINIA